MHDLCRAHRLGEITDAEYEQRRSALNDPCHYLRLENEALKARVAEFERQEALRNWGDNGNT